ncbi:hypothetical protein SAMN05660748_0874 [Blastococcus aggregatus]|uniref:Gram-positive cocci surface proteins LPxTG domain-containing protein n=1 Tax=Blastococcus aggregatus TaxID=38502 RepID=A0A285V0D3_9ACTN|nr:hypothetical protein [Blastococcus aggregatus]SOC47532.1 hypothetical protein SAMN05660748_0874 [Blastococcus aggregatus]
MATGLAAALVAVPAGTAAAADPVDTVTGFLDGLAAEAPSAQTAPGVPAFEVPPAIRAAFQQLADAAMLPENCVDGVADAIELILNGLIALPLELADVLADLLALLGGGGAPLPGDLAALQELLEELLGGLTDAPPAAAPVAADDASALDLPIPVPGAETPEEQPGEELPDEEIPGGESPELPTLIDGLLALGAALQACVPAAAAPAETPKPTTPPVSAPTQQPPAATPAPHTPAPAAQPVAYLGYAPTGADSARADDTSVPLTAVAGGLVLLAGAGAAGHWMRGRAVRTGD